MRNRKTYLPILFLSIFFLPISVFSSTYFVVPTPQGNDSNSGTEVAPWATLQHAADNVTAGDIILIANGSYTPFHITQSGTMTKRILFQANGPNVNINGYESYDGRFAAITVLGHYVTVDGFKIDVGAKDDLIRSRGIRVSGLNGKHRLGVIVRNNTVKNAGWVGITTSFAEGVILQNNDISNSKGQHGIYVANSADNPIVRGNRVYDNDEAGIQINSDLSMGGDGVISNALIENNILYGNGLNGGGSIELDGIASSTIQNNLIYNNLRTGINTYQEDGATPPHDNKILNNTIVMPVGSRHGISFRNASTGVIRNNIVIHLGTMDSLSISTDSITGLDSDYNILTRIEDKASRNMVSLSTWQMSSRQDLHSLVSTVGNLFVNPSATDYRLKSGSPAIDAGITLSSLIADITGVSRPKGMQYDIGAYEYATMTTPPSSRPPPPKNLKVK